MSFVMPGEYENHERFEREVRPGEIQAFQAATDDRLLEAGHVSSLGTLTIPPSG